MANILTYSAMLADSQARQKSLNYLTQSLQRGRLLSRATFCRELLQQDEAVRQATGHHARTSYDEATCQ